MKLKITIWCEDTLEETFQESDKNRLKGKIITSLVPWDLEVDHIDIEETEFEDDKE